MDAAKEANRLTALLQGRTLRQAFRPRPTEVVLQFHDGSRFFASARRDAIELSVTGPDTDRVPDVTSTPEEHRLLAALARMAEQYLSDGDGLDSLSMSAGERAIEELARYGLVDADEAGRSAVWTDAGQAFLSVD